MKRLFLLLAGSFLSTSAISDEPSQRPAAAMFSKATTGTPTLEMDRPTQVRDAVRVQAGDALASADFDALDQTEKRLMTKEGRAPDGISLLPMFLDGLSTPAQRDDASWQKQFAEIEAWQKAQPNSTIPAAALGQAWTKYAWEARGDGYSDTVSADGWKQMADRLQQARKILDDAYAAHHGKDISPCWYSAMQGVALGQGWQVSEYDKMFDEATTAYPDDEFLYFNKAFFLAPRWYGKPGDVEKFAEDCGRKHGLGLYTRILWSASSLYGYDNFFKSDFGARWDLMRTGFEDLEKQWPTSLWNLNAFCHFAVVAQDKPTAKKLYDQIGDNIHVELWDSQNVFLAGKAWADAP